MIEAIAEETKEKGEYAKRKKELTERIASQEKELSEVGENVSSLEAKVRPIGGPSCCPDS